MTAAPLRAAIAVAILVSPAAASAAIVDVQPGDDLIAAFASLQPGDELVFADGTYEAGTGIDVAANGVRDARIIVRGADGARPIIQGSTGNPALRVSGGFTTISNLEIRGGSAGVAINGQSFLVQDLLVTDGDVGIDCEACTDSVLVDNEITNVTSVAITSNGWTGGSVVFNWIHDLPGTASGIVFDGNSSGISIEDNVIETIGGNGIDVSYPGDSPGAAAAFAVLGNWVRNAQNGIIASGPVFIENNIVSQFGEVGIESTIQGLALEIEASVAFNTVVGSGTCFRAIDWALSPAANYLANNALYCAGGSAIFFESGGGESAFVLGNVYDGTADRVGTSTLGSLGSDVVDAAGGNYYPLADGALVDAADESIVVNLDFNGSFRNVPLDVGAYEFTTPENPGGVPGGGFKGDPIGGEPADMGGAGPDAGGIDSDGGTTGGSTPSGPRGSANGSGFPEREGGCSCGSGGDAAAFLLLPIFLLGRRRLRRR